MSFATRIFALHKVKGIKVILRGSKHFLSVVTLGGKNRQLKKKLRAQRDIIPYRKEVLDRFYRRRRMERG